MLYRPAVQDCFLFDDLPDAFVGVFSTMLDVGLYLPGTTLLNQGEAVFESALHAWAPQFFQFFCYFRVFFYSFR